MEISLVSLNSDPRLVKSFLGRPFEVHTINNETHRGNLYVLDPETRNIILLTKPENSLKLINGETVKTVVVLDGNEVDVVEVPLVFDEEEMRVKRKQLKDWLKLNFIKVEEVGDSLKFEDHLVIERPYDLEHVYCENTIVLDRFQKLIAKMPGGNHEL